MDKLVKKIIIKIAQTNPQFTDLQLKKMEYGLLCFFCEITKFILFVLIFRVFSLHGYFIVGCLFFCPIRMLSGGFHCKTYWGCFFFSLIVLFITIEISTYFFLNRSVLIFLLLISFALVCAYSPVDNANKRIISKKRKMKLKICSIIITAILELSCWLLPYKYTNTAVMFIVCSVVLMLVGGFQNLLNRKANPLVS